LKARPGLGTPAARPTVSHSDRPDTAYRQAKGVGIPQRETISELTHAARLLAVYASHPPVARWMARLATGLPATALTGLDSHQLDSNRQVSLTHL